jgi:hypothetical protein
MGGRCVQIYREPTPGEHHEDYFGELQQQATEKTHVLVQLSESGINALPVPRICVYHMLLVTYEDIRGQLDRRPRGESGESIC